MATGIVDLDWPAETVRAVAAELDRQAETIAAERVWAGHAAQTGHHNAQQCIAAECDLRGAIDCPHGEPGHYWHDGCPACDADTDDPVQAPLWRPMDTAPTEVRVLVRAKLADGDYNRFVAIGSLLALGCGWIVEGCDPKSAYTFSGWCPLPDPEG